MKAAVLDLERNRDQRSEQGIYLEALSAVAGIEWLQEFAAEDKSEINNTLDNLWATVKQENEIQAAISSISSCEA